MKKILTLIFLTFIILGPSKSFAGWIDGLKRLPTVGDAAIQSGSLLIFPETNKLSKKKNYYRKLGKILCNSGPAQGFDMVRIMDSVEYLNTGKFKVHSRISCL
tara:strand:+ start:341 stop:649 length:309 start_codon:yes stop_codon:yes gene_type:complete